jgi:4-oxalocrotonate tautomerase
MTNNDEQGVRATLQLYLDGAREGDVDKVRRSFHPQARMSGYLQGQSLVGGPEPYYEAVTNAPPPAKSGEPYQAEITQLAVAERVASATLVESSYLGMHFTTFFHLLKIDGTWQIISKTFMHHQ